MRNWWMVECSLQDQRLDGRRVADAGASDCPVFEPQVAWSRHRFALSLSLLQESQSLSLNVQVWPLAALHAVPWHPNAMAPLC